ncbi:MAG: hypothetical protein V4530_06065 [Pseudomonadota bacterium]
MPQVIPLVVAVGAKVLGASVLVSTIAVAAASVGASLLSAKSAPATQTKINLETIERLNASIDPRTPRKTVVGTTAMATDIRDQEYSADQAYFHRFIVAASHKVHAIREIWFDDVQAWTLAGGVQGKYVGYLDVTPILEGSAGNAINISPRLGASRRFTGCAYVHFKYKLTGNSSNTDSPFAQSIPTRVTIIGDGAYFYDPRRDSTVAGGSGPQRINDQTTWEWSDDACRNPALALLNYCIGWRINGILAVGCGIPLSRLLLSKFITAANMCDEPVTKAVGGTEPRYRCDGIWSEGIARRTVIDEIKKCMNAEFDDFGGGLGPTVIHNDLATPVAAFTADDVLEIGEFNPTVDLDQRFNVVRGTYTDASANSLYQQPDYPQVELASIDGIERADTFPLPFVESPSQCQRLAKTRLQRQQYGGTIPVTFQITGWRVQKNDVITFTFPPLGWVNKLFRVIEADNGTDGRVPLLLRVEHSDIYLWDAEESPAVVAAAPTTYDQGLNPIIVSIDDKTRNVDRGDWASAVNYVIGDEVQKDGSTWGSRTNHLSNGLNGPPALPTTSNTNWQLRAKVGDSGDDAKTIVVNANREQVTFNGANAAAPASQDIVFTANAQNISGAIAWTLKDNLGNTLTPATYLSATTGSSVTMSTANFIAAIAVNAGATGVVAIATGDGIVGMKSVGKTKDGADGASLGTYTYGVVGQVTLAAGQTASFTARGRYDPTATPGLTFQIELQFGLAMSGSWSAMTGGTSLGDGYSPPDPTQQTVTGSFTNSSGVTQTYDVQVAEVGGSGTFKPDKSYFVRLS